jgi:gamma-carbonic anhydrase
MPSTLLNSMIVLKWIQKGVSMIQPYRGIWPKLGKNVYIAPTAAVIGDVTLGDDVSVWPSAVIRGDMAPIVIGDRTNIQDGAVIHTDTHSPTTIGHDVTIGHLAHIHGATIESECLIGSTSTVLDLAIVETHAMVAAGALVTPRMRIPSGQLVAGIPASIKRPLKPEEIAHIVTNAQEYLVLKSGYLPPLDEQ